MKSGYEVDKHNIDLNGMEFTFFMSNAPVCVNSTYSWHILLLSVVTVHYTHCMYDELSSMPYILQHPIVLLGMTCCRNVMHLTKKLDKLNCMYCSQYSVSKNMRVMLLLAENVLQVVCP